jgi:hypothetical protein
VIRVLVSCALFLTGCAASDASGQGEYKALPLPAQVYASPVEVFVEDYRSFPESVEGSPTLDLHLEKGDGGAMVVLLTEKDLRDDALAAIQHRALVRSDASGWRVLQKGERWQCRRGPGSGWTTTPCN